MKRLSYLMVLLGICLLQTPVESLVWQTNYEEAGKLAQAEHKPLLLLFTGSDWCSWCVRLDKEVFSSPEFANAVEDKFIFVKLDFPMKQPLAVDIAKQNQLLKTQFLVLGFPSVVLLNSDRDLIGTAGYVAGGGKLYADMLLEMVNKTNKVK